MDLNQNRKENIDEGSHEFNDKDSENNFPQTQQHAAKRPASSHKSQSRPTSRAASIGQQSSRTRSNSRTNKLWSSANPFINFMSEFRKTQTGEKSANIFRLGGEQWRNMTEDDKQPFIDAANQNKKLKPQSKEKKQKQKEIINPDKQQSKTSTSKDISAPNKSSNASRKVPSPKKKSKRSVVQHKQETLKKKQAKSDTDTDNTDTETSGSIHTATTDCASDDSDESP